MHTKEYAKAQSEEEERAISEPIGEKPENRRAIFIWLKRFVSFTSECISRCYLIHKCFYTHVSIFELEVV